MRQNWIRITYSVASLLGIFVAYKMKSVVVDTPTGMNNFSYVGTVATLIALMIAIAEVLHSLHVSKSIRDEARDILGKVKLIEGASSISECLSALDEVSQSVSSEQYATALKSFQYLRKTYVKVSPSIQTLNLEGEDLSILGKIEFTLQKATHASSKAPFDKRQKTSLAKDILLLKQKLENGNPARGANDAAA